jgi:hypothetical protein
VVEVVTVASVPVVDVVEVTSLLFVDPVVLFESVVPDVPLLVSEPTVDSETLVSTLPVSMGVVTLTGRKADDGVYCTAVTMAAPLSVAAANQAMDDERLMRCSNNRK